jgi:glycosyltransferase involved in cell wall biosynthesis
MKPEETPQSFTPDETVVSEYRALAAGEYSEGELGRLLIVTSTDDLTLSRGDLYVALGLAKYLRRLGWGITLWPTERYGEQTPEGYHAAIVMIETYIPGLIHPDTHAIAWVRNWTERWAALPYLDRFAQIWCSSNASAERMREAYDGPVEVLPLATDPELFHPVDVERAPSVVTTANFWGVDRGLISALSTLATNEKVTWFGKNARFLEGLPPGIDHRHTMDYFSLPWVYSAWQFVIDDVIDAAAIYGTQNSRLFDALSSGALVITNTANGLTELGLEELPTYDGPDSLADVMGRLRADAETTHDLTERLRAVVVERHTYAARAAFASDLLQRPLSATGERDALMAWVSRLREEYRRNEFDYNDLRVVHNDTHQEVVRLQRRADALEVIVENQPIRRLRRYARFLLHPRDLVARLRPRRGSTES